MKKTDIVVGGIYENGKTGRYYSERKVTEIFSYSSIEIPQVKFEIVGGYIPHQLDEKKGRVGLPSFAAWAKTRINTENVLYAESIPFQCVCGETLEATWNKKEQGPDRIHCRCGQLWVFPQPYHMDDPEKT